ncbi:hypothetical protein D3C72_1530890 [compost metagenome]
MRFDKAHRFAGRKEFNLQLGTVSDHHQQRIVLLDRLPRPGQHHRDVAVHRRSERVVTLGNQFYFLLPDALQLAFKFGVTPLLLLRQRPQFRGRRGKLTL